MSKDNSGPAFSLEAQELNEKIDRLQNEVSSPKKQLRGARTMTEIPGGFPKKVCPETFVSNHTKTSDKYPTAGPPNEFKSLNELKADAAREIYERAEAALEDRIVSIISRSTFRLSEDQIQRLMRCIIFAQITDFDSLTTFDAEWIKAESTLKHEPKPAPENQQILSDLWRDYNEGKEELLKAKQEIERRTEERDIARDHAFDLFNQLNKAEQEIERLKAQIADYQKQHEMTMGVGDGDGNLFVHGSQEAIHRVREYLSAIEQLVKEKHELKAQVPKERACVILGPYGENYELFMAPIIFGDRESATKWAEDHGLEVVE